MNFIDLQNCLKDTPIDTIVTIYEQEDKIELQFNGWSITLLKDDSYLINNTTGG